MTEIYFDLEQTLRSRKEPLTLQEVNALTAWRARVKRDFYIGLSGGSTVTYLGAQKVSKLLRLCLTVGVGTICALWRVRDSVQSSVRHTLSLEGSRIQLELANILLKKYGHIPWVIQHLSKHFYPEEVYNESAVDRPVVRWRYRNFSGGYFDHFQTTSCGAQEAHSSDSHVKKTTLEPQQVQVNAADNAIDNPFDLIFGLPESAENVSMPVEQLSSSKKQRRKLKRSLRRRRRYHHYHQEECDD